MKCIVCGSIMPLKKKYDNHTGFSLKSILKKLLPYFDFIIPESIPNLKRHSRNNKKYSTNQTALFKGYIRICSNCGHGVMELPPTKSQLQQYYQNLYWSQRSTVFKSNSYIHNPRAAHQVDFILDHIHCEDITSILEIGAGAANASQLLREKCKNPSINIYACEPGQQWGNFYRNQNIKKIADYFPFETDMKFDYVHTSHWLEHVLDLDEILSNLNAIINTKGSIFIEVPNTEHYYWDIPMRDTPHIHFFTRKSLIKAFNNNNFECLNIGEYGIKYIEKLSGVTVTPDRYGACENGFWIRALFKKMG